MNHAETIADNRVKDPVCGMMVDPATAKHRAEHGGRTYHFCSARCAERFRKDPQGILSKGAAAEAAPASCCAGQSHHPAQAPAATTPAVRAGDKYICPMCPGVESPEPGACPKCGMALERAAPAKKIVKYTCPMHPEVVQDGPGNCPKCGMALEPMAAPADEPNPELADMTRRFWIGLAFTVPLLALAMAHYVPGFEAILQRLIGPQMNNWLQLALAAPVVLWAAWPFFERGWRSVATWNLNMFTLIALGVGAASA